MGRTFNTISGALPDWIERQPVFFVGTAPGGEGHVNVSPKGRQGTLAILGPRTVAYIDLMGSGIETIAHPHDNGRIVLMFCAFSGPPRIVRRHGQGRAVLEGEPGFGALLDQFPLRPEARGVARAVVVVEVARIADSCGYGVPLMEFVSERDQIFRWAETREAKQGPGWREDYQREKNTVSIDGLPGIDPVATELKAVVTTA